MERLFTAPLGDGASIAIDLSPESPRLNSNHLQSARALLDVLEQSVARPTMSGPVEPAAPADGVAGNDRQTTEQPNRYAMTHTITTFKGRHAHVVTALGVHNRYVFVYVPHESGKGEAHRHYRTSEPVLDAPSERCEFFGLHCAMDFLPQCLVDLLDSAYGDDEEEFTVAFQRIAEFGMGEHV